MGKSGRISTIRDDLKEELRDFNLTVKKDCSYNISRDAAVELPSHFPEGTSCRVVLLAGCFVNVYCGVGDAQKWLASLFPFSS